MQMKNTRKNSKSSLLTGALSFLEVWMQYHQVFRLLRYKSLSHETFQKDMYSSLLLSTKLQIPNGFQRHLHHLPRYHHLLAGVASMSPK